MTDAATFNRDRIVRVRFSGLRTAADVQLDCEPMNVLIGPNAVGKSTLIEGLDLLGKIGSSDFVRALNDEHGGTTRLLRNGAPNLRLGLDITDERTSMSYDIILVPRAGNLVIEHEVLTSGEEMLLARDGEELDLGASLAQSPKPRSISPRASALAAVSVFSSLAARMISALAGIEIHVPFATQARWFGQGMVPERNMRTDNLIQATGRLDRGGADLASAFHALRNRPDWPDTLETIRLVVDDDITDVTTPATASGGNIGLVVAYRTSGSVPAFALSDGTLALLALIALMRLDGGDAPRSLLVLDEPDLHLDPGAIGQVVALLQECSAHQPVVIATHSDRLLDCLSEPARSAILCDLDEQRRLRVRRPDRALLERWLKTYRGLGHLRAEGYDQLVFPLPSLRAAENT